MEDIIGSLENEFHSIIENELFVSLSDEITEHFEKFEALQDKLNQLYNTPSANESELSKKKYKTLELITDAWNPSKSESFSDFSPSYVEKLNNLVQTLPEEIEGIQNESRFRKTSEDGLLLGLKKQTKNLVFQISKSPTRFANIFRKNSVPIARWSHLIPIRGMAHHYFLSGLCESLIKVRDEQYRVLSIAYQQIKTWEESITLEMNVKVPDFTTDLKSKLDEIDTGIKQNAKKQLELTLEKFHGSLATVNTIEQKATRYTEFETAESYSKVDLSWQKHDRDWNHTFEALFEEWRSDLEISCLILGVRTDLGRYKAAQEKNLGAYIGPEIETIISFIEDTKKEIDEEKSPIATILKKANYQAQKSLDKVVIPRLVEKLSNRSIINAITNLEASLYRSLGKLTTERKTPKTPSDYMEPIESDEMTTISPFELITFEIAPALNNKIDTIKADLVAALGKNIEVSQDLDHMITFGLNSAIEVLNTNPDSQHDASVLALESLDRSAKRIEEIQIALNKAFEASSEQLSEALSEYSDSLLVLMENESVRDIRVRIVKAKALKQTEAYRQELKDQAKNRGKVLLSKIGERFTYVNSLIQEVRQKFILTAKKEAATKEVSDFLSSSQEAIEALPIIYRNLYRIEPLSDLELFVGRKNEIDQLIKAYQNWESGKLGSSIIVGEKWSGLTSLINYIEHESHFKRAVNRKSCVTQEDHLLQVTTFFSELLDEKLLSVDEIAERLSDGPKRVIVFEDLQNLYLKKVGGFVGIKALLELISKTGKQVFWITTSTLYTYKFFQRTLQIQDVFSYIINLQKPTTKEVISLIEKRNRISGYHIQFTPTNEDEKSKKFLKLTEDQQQKYLEERFFKKLIDFSESNISMALMFWLLSTKSVDHNQITIGAFRKPDLSFLSTLSQEKILSLHQLILHDGLSIDAISQVSNMSKQNAFLNISMLLEDGILIHRDGSYLVNPLVYRSVINLLKTKNLIY
ncbi:MAG: ATP-binding protein [Cyclobacteriaceae bacterium]